MARSTTNPNSSAWKVVHELDRMGQATDERLAEQTGLNRGELAVVLRKLKYTHVVNEVGGQEVTV